MIAVMPFKNLSSEPESDYFVDGLTSEVIRISRSSTVLRDRRPRSLFQRQAARPQGNWRAAEGQLIVEADVLRVGNKLRINAQLVPIDSDVPLWSERSIEPWTTCSRFRTRSTSDRQQASSDARQRPAPLPDEPQAYELYLRAMAVRAGSGEERGIEAAVKLQLQQVISIDPAFAPAHTPAWRAPTRPRPNVGVFKKPERAACRLRALQLDPLLAEAHVAMGVTHTAERDFENAVKSFENALKLNPTHPGPHGASTHWSSRDTKNGHCSRAGDDHGPPVAHRAAGSRIRAVPQWPLRGRNRESAKGHDHSIPSFRSASYSRVR